ncbi:hypothetical protein NDU88_006691 [Pleurodeles waltl]|uniref:Uncharacterized protein n=1 Tax=Pleurodeles waltl TaxID=8319 RepID=A0AAV7TZ92_PLEWA|nr:hypothetical protein NDU88_006691 [Pleurodeles waltl]
MKPGFSLAFAPDTQIPLDPYIQSIAALWEDLGYGDFHWLQEAPLSRRNRLVWWKMSVKEMEGKTRPLARMPILNTLRPHRTFALVGSGEEWFHRTPPTGPLKGNGSLVLVWHVYFSPQKVFQRAGTGAPVAQTSVGAVGVRNARHTLGAALPGQLMTGNYTKAGLKVESTNLRV